MIYLLAAVGAVTVVLLLWKFFSAEATPLQSENAHRPVGPDDDPEFLRRLDEQRRADED